MALTSVAASIAPLRRMLPVKITGGSWQGSEFVESTPQDATRNLAPIPLSASDLKALDAGEFTIQDVKFYLIVGDGEPLKEKDQVQYLSAWREVRKINDRSEDGGYYQYITKRVTV